MESPSRYCRLQIAMTRRFINRRTHFDPSTAWQRLIRDGDPGRLGSERRIYGEADRRKEIHAELAAMHRRASDSCNPNCVHSQDAMARP